jgi:hypothetical protein
MKTSTRFQKSKKKPKDITVLKPGGNNAKLGFNVTAKKWRGKKLYSVTLIERETCPTDCHHWEDCYGDSMPFAHRFELDGLEEAIEKEIPTLLKKHKHGIVIRLHVLGDFYSVAYVKFWEKLLKRHKKLCIFGYTGRRITSHIGKRIQRMNNAFEDKCLIRYSRSEDYDGEHSFAAEESFDGDSFDCPEQKDKVKDCASCGLCWMVKKTVKFYTH